MKVQHPLDWGSSRKPVRRDVAPMGEVYSHLSEEERQVIQIEIGNGTSVRKMARLLGRSPSGISGEAKRNTWFPSDENGSCQPCRPKRLKTRGRADAASPAPRGAGPSAGAPRRASATACHANACGRGWPNGRVAAGRRHPSAAGRASRSPTTPPCACARRPSTVGSTPTVIAVSAGRAAFHAAAGGGAGVAAGGRRVSRSPDGLPSPSVRRRPATAAVSAIGRPTA